MLSYCSYARSVLKDFCFLLLNPFNPFVQFKTVAARYSKICTGNLQISQDRIKLLYIEDNGVMQGAKKKNISSYVKRKCSTSFMLQEAVILFLSPTFVASHFYTLNGSRIFFFFHSDAKLASLLWSNVILSYSTRVASKIIRISN